MGDDSYDYDSGFHLFSGVQHCKEFGTYLFPRLLVVTKCAGLRGSGLHDHDRVEFLQENLGNSDNGTSTLYPETRDFANPDVQARQLLSIQSKLIALSGPSVPTVTTHPVT